MGLVLLHTSKEMNVGSYSGVQTERKNLVTATIEYLEGRAFSDERDNAARQDAIDMLRGWIGLDDGEPLSAAEPIDYAATPDNLHDIHESPGCTGLARLDLIGVLWFVNHSDCDGWLSLGQAQDVARALRIVPFAKHVGAPDYAGELLSFFASVTGTVYFA